MNKHQYRHEVMWATLTRVYDKISL